MPGTRLAVPPAAKYDYSTRDHDEQNHQEYRAPMLSRVGHSATSSNLFALNWMLNFLLNQRV
jgi:hypothetical protein